MYVHWYYNLFFYIMDIILVEHRYLTVQDNAHFSLLFEVNGMGEGGGVSQISDLVRHGKSRLLFDSEWEYRKYPALGN